MKQSSALLSVSQVRHIEHLAFNSVDEESLMERAGGAAFSLIQSHFSDAFHITVLCGTGNNGGDGFVLARLATISGLAVKVILFGEPAKQTPLAHRMLQQVQDVGVEVVSFEDGIALHDTDLIVDAMLGIGLQGEVRKPYSSAIEIINKGDVPVFSLDIPSGMNADTGKALGQAVVADLSLTFIGTKLGMVTGIGKHLCGEIYVEHLGLETLLSQQAVNGWQVDQTLLMDLLPVPVEHAHKCTMGHVVIIGGDQGKPGAVCLAAEAALRVGAGKVTIITRDAHFNIVMSARSEFICHTVENDWSNLNVILETADACVIGPGMQDTEWSRQAVNHGLQFDGAKVIDAGALSLLAKTESGKIANSIVTPHPGEAAAMLDLSVSQIEANRYGAAKKITEAYSDVAVIKGAGTIVQSNGENAVPMVCVLGNPGMATAGMGDLLAGMIGGLAGQMSSLSDAALAGVVLHAFIGDIAADELGQATLLAGDMFDYFGDGIKQYQEAWVLESH